MTDVDRLLAGRLPPGPIVVICGRPDDARAWRDLIGHQRCHAVGLDEAPRFGEPLRGASAQLEWQHDAIATLDGSGWLAEQVQAFDPHTAAALVKEGIAQYVPTNKEEGIFGHVYRRPLNDYPQAFRNVRNQQIATDLAIAELDRQIKAIQESIKLAQDTERVRKEEAAKRTADLEKLNVEAETMQKLHDAWVQTTKAARDKVESLKQSIGSQADELARLQLQAAQATGQRAASR